MKTQVWMSHGDKVTNSQPLRNSCSSNDDEYWLSVIILEIFLGSNFHTEVKHSTKGEQILLNSFENL